MFYIFISILAGVSVVVSRIINSNLAKIIGIFQGTFFNYVIGLIFSLMFLFISKETIQISNVKPHSIPSWAYLGGLVGVLVVVLSSYVTPKISAFYLTLLIFIGQLFFGIIIDFLTLEKLSLGKIIGGILVLLGLIYNLMLDKKQELP
ncbi:EamA-like transporter family protein [Clostridium homopropionicum DSM 5847]|uniref:EamA-like transporter family protein n=1 Tax=Clostridium homopropionicum DSM 5847 TaxID=1121318 RepID=A0A0L6Z8V9_9CLOT|nr:DMT family transporter [Clostridium homopropionicum]KOA19412.1 EamA-like transporter family protein [Clostridium homopropionicum DSM 5847]SFG68999.1 transporter family-2 protein [Clostridium homopropionicum]